MITASICATLNSTNPERMGKVNEKSNVADGVKEAFNRVLNSHGYGFHYAVIKTASDLYSNRKSLWTFEAAEVPVETQGASTRIDFVLQRRGPYYDDQAPFYIVAECKRANPSLSNWCFAKAPYVGRSRSHEPYIIENVEVNGNAFRGVRGKSYSLVDDAYHIAVEVRSNAKGDASGPGRGNIEEAVAQVCRGLNGLIRSLPSVIKSEGTVVSADLLPVVFTTADLFVTDADLSSAEISSGEIDLTKSKFESRQWVVLQYHMSPGLKHDLFIKPQVGGLSEFLDLEYIRSVPIVNYKGVEAFLLWASKFDRK